MTKKKKKKTKVDGKTVLLPQTKTQKLSLGKKMSLKYSR